MNSIHILASAPPWQEVTGVQPQPSAWIVLVTAVVGFAAVIMRNVWPIVRSVVTIAHEGGHALVALLVGRRLEGIRLHSDTSGVTISRGKPDGPGVVATSMAGYTAAPLLGLGFAALLAHGRITLLLWISVVVLAALLIKVRNAFGVVSILSTGATVFLVSWSTPASVQAAFAYAATWFLLFGGVRPIFELQRKRRKGLAADSDADQLAKLTRIPGLLWVFLFAVIALGSVVLGAMWLVPNSPLS